MTAKLPWLNGLSEEEAVAQLLRCCGCERWAHAMAKARPFANRGALLNTADDLWDDATDDERLEAFSHHPHLGAAAHDVWAKNEQSGASEATPSTLDALAAGNRAYDEKFGFVFLLCATGKSADEMLAAITRRLPHDRSTEIAIAAEEQRKITRLRLEKLIS